MPVVFETNGPVDEMKLMELEPQSLDVPDDEILDRLIRSNIDDDSKTKEDNVHHFFETLYQDYPLIVAKNVSRVRSFPKLRLICTVVGRAQVQRVLVLHPCLWRN
jgi:hypothetical protein